MVFNLLQLTNSPTSEINGGGVGKGEGGGHHLLVKLVYKRKKQTVYCPKVSGMVLAGNKIQGDRGERKLIPNTTFSPLEQFCNSDERECEPL